MNYTYNNLNTTLLQDNIKNLQKYSLCDYTNIFKSIKIEESKKEILMIGKFSSFKNRMDTMYYEFLQYFKDNSSYDIVFVDTDNCKKSRTYIILLNIVKLLIQLFIILYILIQQNKLYQIYLKLN